MINRSYLGLFSLLFGESFSLNDLVPELVESREPQIGRGYFAQTHKNYSSLRYQNGAALGHLSYRSQALRRRN